MNLVSRGMVKTALGAIAYLSCGNENSLETPILCFHSSPRSSDEFLEILPLLSSSGDGGDDGGRRVIALDTPGYGSSENPNKSCTIDEIADAFLEVADALNIQKFITVGNLMGNLPAVSLASRSPDRVTGCILANIFYYNISPSKEEEEEGDDDKDDGGPKGKRQKTDQETKTVINPIPDSFELMEDGSHLTNLHNKRKWLDPELNLRVVQSELNYLVNRRIRYAKGVTIQDLSTFDFESQARRTVCPTLCIKGQACCDFFDAIGLEGTKQFESGSKKFSSGDIQTLSGPKSTINMINQEPEEFVALCHTFLKKNKL